MAENHQGNSASPRQERERKGKGTSLLTQCSPPKTPIDLSKPGRQAPPPPATRFPRTPWPTTIRAHPATWACTASSPTWHTRSAGASTPAHLRQRPGCRHASLRTRTAWSRETVWSTSAWRAACWGGEPRAASGRAPGYRPNAHRLRSPPPRSLGPSPPLPRQPPRSWRSRPGPARFPATTPARSPSPALEAVLASPHVPFPLRRTRTFQSPGNHRYCCLCNISFSSPSTVVAHEKYYWSSQVRSTWSELGTIGWSGARFTRPTSLSSSRTGLLVGLQRWDNPQGPGCWEFLLREPHQAQAIVEESACLWHLIKKFSLMSQPQWPEADGAAPGIPDDFLVPGNPCYISFELVQEFPVYSS